MRRRWLKRGLMMLGLWLPCSLPAATVDHVLVQTGYAATLSQLPDIAAAVSEDLPKDLPDAQRAHIKRLLAEAFSPVVLKPLLETALKQDLPAPLLSRLSASFDALARNAFAQAERQAQRSPEALRLYYQRLQITPVAQARRVVLRDLGKAAGNYTLTAAMETAMTHATADLMTRYAPETPYYPLSDKAIRGRAERASEGFLFYAYRHFPSDDIAAYTASYQTSDFETYRAAVVAAVKAVLIERTAWLMKEADVWLTDPASKTNTR